VGYLHLCIGFFDTNVTPKTLNASTALGPMCDEDCIFRLYCPSFPGSIIHELVGVLKLFSLLQPTSAPRHINAPMVAFSKTNVGIITLLINYSSGLFVLFLNKIHKSYFKNKKLLNYTNIFNGGAQHA
jgi:hypothetical protein